MMDLDFIEALIRAMDESSLDSIELERGGTRIRLSKSPQGTGAPAMAGTPLPALVPSPTSVQDPAPARGGATGGAATEPEGGSDDAPEASNLVEVTSPMVGTFYRSPSPDSEPFTSTGGTVGVGDVLCIIEAMKLMNELEAEMDGTVREICVKNGEPVEYGQVLFRIEPA